MKQIIAAMLLIISSSGPFSWASCGNGIELGITHLKDQEEDLLPPPDLFVHPCLAD